MKLMSGLVEVAVTVAVQQQTTQRRYDTENSKRPADRASDKLEQLKATLSEVTHTESDTDIVHRSVQTWDKKVRFKRAVKIL